MRGDWARNARPGIYKITNIINRKFYIGSAVSISDRWDKHRGELRRGTHKNPHLQRAWNKNKEVNFKFTVLEYVEDKNFLLMREQHWINWFGATEIGYNINKLATAGGNNKIKFDESLLGTMPDHVLAKKLGTNKTVIAKRRKSLGIKSYAEKTGNNGKVKKGQSLPPWSESRRKKMKKWRAKSVSNKNSKYMIGLKRAGIIRRFKKNSFDICTPIKQNKYANLIKRG